MKHAKQKSTSVAVQGVPMGGYNGNNYAGYYSSQADNGNIPYEQVAGNWTVPTVPSEGSTNEVGSWVGIGGILSGGKDALQQAGVIAIASSPPSYRFFWENYNSSESSPVLQGPPVTGGDTVYVDVYYDPSTADTTYYMENLTTDRTILPWPNTTTPAQTLSLRCLHAIPPCLRIRPCHSGVATNFKVIRLRPANGFQEIFGNS